MVKEEDIAKAEQRIREIRGLQKSIAEDETVIRYLVGNGVPNLETYLVEYNNGRRMTRITAKEVLMVIDDRYCANKQALQRIELIGL